MGSSEIHHKQIDQFAHLHLRLTVYDGVIGLRSISTPIDFLTESSQLLQGGTILPID